MREIVYLVLPDGLMIFLGLLMAPIVIIPLAVPSLPQPVTGLLNIADIPRSSPSSSSSTSSNWPLRRNV